MTNILYECHNPFIQYYKTAKECLDSYRQSQGPMRIILNTQMRLIMETGADQRRENLPTANEIAVLIPDEYNEPGHRDIVLAQRLPDGQSTRLHNIPHTHPAYMPLHYVLLFPHGNPGWRWSLLLVNENAQQQRTRLSERMWYRYHLFHRTGIFSVIHRGGKLFQQYLVDSYAVIDQAVLEYLRHHQSTIRADLYNGV